MTCPAEHFLLPCVHHLLPHTLCESTTTTATTTTTTTTTTRLMVVIQYAGETFRALGKTCHDAAGIPATITCW